MTKTQPRYLFYNSKESQTNYDKVEPFHVSCDTLMATLDWSDSGGPEHSKTALFRGRHPLFEDNLTLNQSALTSAKLFC